MHHAPLRCLHLFPQFYPHGACDVLCLPVCCVWVSGSQRPWQFCLSDQTRPRCDFHNAEPKQTGGPRRLLDRLSVTTGLFSDSLHDNTFQNMPTAAQSLPKPFRLQFGSVNILHISTYLQQQTSRAVQLRVCATGEQLHWPFVAYEIKSVQQRRTDSWPTCMKVRLVQCADFHRNNSGHNTGTDQEVMNREFYLMLQINNLLCIAFVCLFGILHTYIHAYHDEGRSSTKVLQSL